MIGFVEFSTNQVFKSNNTIETCIGWCVYSDDITYIENPATHLFIVGEIQGVDLQQANFLFDIDQLKSSISQLNGHFSIVHLCKQNQLLTLFTNKSGGNRLYVKKMQASWKISNVLYPLVDDSNVSNKTALLEEFRYRWITGEHSLVDGIYQIPSGHYWHIKDGVIQQKHCYFTLPKPEHLKENKTVEELAIESERLLSSAINNMVIPDSKVAIFLSGGVDSSILAAIANKAGHELVAISHRSRQHENPELETAITFAKELNIEHRIIDIDDRDIAEAFIQTTHLIEQAPRFQSSLIIYLMLKEIAGEFSQIIYGEAADTLFGNNALKRYLTRYQKQQKLLKLANCIPFFSKFKSGLPANKITRLLDSNVEQFITETNSLELNADVENMLHNQIKQSENYSFYRLQEDAPIGIADLEQDLLKIKRFALDTDVDNHFHETGAIAQHFGIDLVSPFVDLDVIKFAANLPIKHTISGDVVKPILRKIGEGFFKPELMYLPKKGFPAPHKSWLKGSLINLVENGINYFEAKEVDVDDETKWTMAGLYLLSKKLNVTFKK